MEDWAEIRRLRRSEGLAIQAAVAGLVVGRQGQAVADRVRLRVVPPPLVEVGGRVMPVPVAAAAGIKAQRSGDTLSTIIRRPASSITSGDDLAAWARDDMINAQALLDLDASQE